MSPVLKNEMIPEEISRLMTFPTHEPAIFLLEQIEQQSAVNKEPNDQENSLKAPLPQVVTTLQSAAVVPNDSQHQTAITPTKTRPARRRTLEKVTLAVVSHFKKHTQILPEDKHTFGGRRAYDVLNVMTGMGLVEKMGRGKIIYLTSLGQKFFYKAVQTGSRKRKAHPPITETEVASSNPPPCKKQKIEPSDAKISGSEASSNAGNTAESKLSILTVIIWDKIANIENNSPFRLSELNTLAEGMFKNEDTAKRRVYETVKVMRHLGCLNVVKVLDTLYGTRQEDPIKIPEPNKRYHKMYQLTSKGIWFKSLQTNKKKAC